MNEASRVVAENQIQRITGGSIKVEELSAEAAMALTLFGIYGLAEFPLMKPSTFPARWAFAWRASPAVTLRRAASSASMPRCRPGPGGQQKTGEETSGYYAPLLRKGSKMRLARPDERHPKRLEHPQSEWDLLHGMLMAHQEGDVPVARAYLNRNAEGNEDFFKALLQVWAAEITDEDLRKEAQALLFGLNL